MKRLLLTLALLVVVAVSNAQVTTSSLRGVVTANDKPLVGATIVAIHTPSGTQYGTVSNSEGGYALSGMRVGGPYTIIFSYVGYNDTKITEHQLRIGQNEEINANLTEAAIDVDNVMVVAYQAYNKEDSYSRSEIEKIPSIDRSIYDLTSLMSTSIAPASGGIILGGQSTRYNAFTIDGTPSADIYGLGTTGMTGSLTEANPIPIDALEAVSITTSSVDVRESGFTGGAIKAITRSGDNEFRGSAYTYFNNEHFWGTTPGKDVASRSPLSQQTTNIVGVTLGGPIIRNKLFFFVSGEFNRNITPSTNHPGSGHSALTLDEAQQISDIYKERTERIDSVSGNVIPGYDGGGYHSHNVSAITGSAVARLDWNINDHNHLSLRYNMLQADAHDCSVFAES